MIRVLLAAMEDSTVESVRSCLHVILFLFTPLNLQLATFDLDKKAIRNVKFEVVFGHSLYQ